MILDLSNVLDIKKAQLYFTKLVESQSKVELKKIIPKRTLKLNAYLHVCITLYAIHFGYTIEESKTLLKRECDFMRYTKNNIVFLKKTSKLDNSECSKFVEWIRNYASQNGCYIPDAEEYKANQYAIDKDINSQKQYL